MKEISPVVRLALDAISSYVTDRKVIDPPEDPPVEMQIRAGVFVSLDKDGHLRGCMGTIEPMQDNVALEIIRNAITAAVNDPRFLPVREDDLPHLVCSVDVLMEPEPVEDISTLDPDEYGVIVRSGTKKGVLLPNLEGVTKVEEQIEIACRKAGINPNGKFELSRFGVKRYY